MTAQEKENDNGRVTSVATEDRQVRDQNQEAGENGEMREPEFGEGIIEISGKGFGFLRDSEAKLCPDAAGYFCHAGNRAPLCFARRDVDSR